MRAGEIDGHPAYTGTSLSIVFGEEVSGLDAERTYDQVKQLYEARGQALSAMTPYENVDAIATTNLLAQREQLRAIADLRELDRFTLGARPEFEDLYLGLEGLQQVYGLTNATFAPVTLGAQYTALDQGDVDAANVFTTDPQLQGGDLHGARGSREAVRLAERGDGRRRREARARRGRAVHARWSTRSTAG